MTEIKSIEPRLHVASIARSIQFYKSILAFDVDVSWPEENPEFAILQKDDLGLQLVSLKMSGSNKPSGGCTIWIDMENVLGFHARLEKTLTIEWGASM